ncbi:MAG: hypothetical protein JNJ49_11710 [Bdellovibrionaceae bacterium]|nr:hypothetical protein [Pseudobdellovibrionaceae bacterium]
MNQSIAGVQAAGQQRNPWIKDPWFDWAFIHIGVILLPLVCLLRYTADFTFERGYFFVMLLLWAGHHLTPIFLLYADRRVHDLAIRHAPKLKLGILATSLLPLAGYVAAGGLYWETGRHTAWTYMPIAIVSLIYLLWSSYHICAQHFGIMQLYRKRMGLISAGARAFEMKLFVITLTVLTIMIWFHNGVRDEFLVYYGIHFRFSPWFPFAMGGFLVTLMLGTLYRLKMQGELRLQLALCYIQCFFLPIAMLIYPLYITMFLYTGLHYIADIALGSLMYSNLKAERSHRKQNYWVYGTMLGLMLAGAAYYVFHHGLPFMQHHNIQPFGAMVNLDTVDRETFVLVCTFCGLNMGMQFAHIYISRPVYKSSEYL